MTEELSKEEMRYFRTNSGVDTSDEDFEQCILGCVAFIIAFVALMVLSVLLYILFGNGMKI